MWLGVAPENQLVTESPHTFQTNMIIGLIIMKQCFKCNTEKPLSEFYKHPRMLDGHVNKCKECNKKDVRKNYRVNIDKYKIYERKRTHLPHRIALRTLSANPTTYCVIPKDHKASTDMDCRVSWTIKNPNKKKASDTLLSAVKNGNVKKYPCVFCGEHKSQGHHYDYSKPLDVIWLCAKHHARVHSGKIQVFTDNQELLEKIA